MHLQDTLQHVGLQKGTITQQASDKWSSSNKSHRNKKLCFAGQELLSISSHDTSIHFLLSMVILVIFINCFCWTFFECPQLLNTAERNILSARPASSISRLLSCVWMVLFFLKQTVCNWCEHKKQFINHSGHIQSKGRLIGCNSAIFCLPKKTCCWNQTLSGRRRPECVMVETLTLVRALRLASTICPLPQWSKHGWQRRYKKKDLRALGHPEHLCFKEDSTSSSP